MEIFSSAQTGIEEVVSIYFGGGTPSLLPAHHIAELLDACRRCFLVSEDCEISMEANPGTLSAEKAAMFRQSRVNRISMGAQSFADLELTAIGRLHNAKMIKESLGQLQDAGFININLDLLLGLPYQTAESWRMSLENTADLGVPHVSVYMLELDESCPLQSFINDGRLRTPEEDLIADLYLETIQYLSSRGLHQYEISNFARPAYSCLHNLRYWTRDPVIGFGLGSHSFDGRVRYANYSTLDEYFQAIAKGDLPVEWRQSIEDDQALEEELFLGLRLNRGVNWRKLQKLDAGDRLVKLEKSLCELSHRGLIDWTNSVVRLTPSGMLLSNEIFQLFV